MATAGLEGDKTKAAFRFEEELAELAERANESHQAYEGLYSSRMVGANAHVRAAGEALNEAKRRIEHGQWGDWLAQNFKGSAVTARLYMRVATKWPEIEAANLQDASLEAIRAHLAGPPKEPKSKKDDKQGAIRMIELKVTSKRYGEFHKHMAILNSHTETTGETVCRIVREAFYEHLGRQQG